MHRERRSSSATSSDGNYLGAGQARDPRCAWNREHGARCLLNAQYYAQAQGRHGLCLWHYELSMSGTEFDRLDEFDRWLAREIVDAPCWGHWPTAVWWARVKGRHPSREDEAWGDGSCGWKEVHDRRCPHHQTPDDMSEREAKELYRAAMRGLVEKFGPDAPAAHNRAGVPVIGGGR